MGEHKKARRETRGIAILLASLSALGPFSIDTYLPSFHEIAEKLNATPLEVQQTLSAYLMSFAIMTLWHGAISDRFGRRKVILVALGLFALASAGCTLATRIEHLWFWRAMQGITAGAGMVVSRAIVRDLYDGAAAQRLMSQITMMFALAPAIAPVIGGWLQTFFGWRSVFAFLVVSTAALWLACWKLLPETLRPEKRQSLRPAYLGKTYWKVMTSPAFLLASAAVSLNFAGFFDPATGGQTTAVSRFFGIIVSWLFIVINGHLLVVAALVQSFGGEDRDPWQVHPRCSGAPSPG